LTDARIEMLVKTRDGLRMAADSIDDYLETLGPKATVDTFPDLTMLLWKDAIGEKGPFELAETKNNAKNAAFDRLTSYLDAHNGKATISGYFTWKFTDGSGNIGRKLVQKQP
jgi:hypothetical protein